MNNKPQDLDRRSRARQTGRLLRHLNDDYLPIQFMNPGTIDSGNFRPGTIYVDEVPDHWGLLPLAVYDTEENRIEAGLWPLNLN